jgi:Tfp pilus assembly protein PilV
MARSRLPALRRTRRQQRGDALMESLIAMLLMTVVCMGMVLGLGRAMVAQKYQKAMSLAVQGIRGSLQRDGVASNCPANGTAITPVTLTLTNSPVGEVQKTCTITAVTVTAGGVSKTATVPVVTYSVQAQTLLGPGTLTVSN